MSLTWVEFGSMSVHGIFMGLTWWGFGNETWPGHELFHLNGRGKKKERIERKKDKK